MQPVIGIMPLVDEERKSLWMLPGYMDGIREAAGMPIMFPLTTNPEEIICACKLCDGFLFTGGQDVEPKMYGESKIGDIVCCCEQRDITVITIKL